MKVSIICCGRLENRYAVEFVDYYKKLGFDHIFILDNNHTGEEHFEDVLQSYIDDNFITIYNYRNLEIVQGYILDVYYKIINDYDWIFFCDFDEYLTLEKDKNIKDYLSRKCFENYDQILINWKIYSDNNLVYDDGRPCLKRFNTVIDHFRNGCTKPFIRTNLKDLNFFTVHCFYNDILFNTTCNDKGNKIIYTNKDWLFDPDYELSYIKHFTTKTIDEWIKNKMKRGTGDRTYSSFLEGYNLNEFFKYNNITKEKIKYLKDHNIDYTNINL